MSDYVDVDQCCDLKPGPAPKARCGERSGWLGHWKAGLVTGFCDHHKRYGAQRVHIMRWEQRIEGEP